MKFCTAFPGGRVADNKESRAFDGEIGVGLGILEGPLAEDVIDDRHADPAADLADPAGTGDLAGQEISEDGPGST